jgi:FkbM family methyltransferase
MVLKVVHPMPVLSMKLIRRTERKFALARLVYSGLMLPRRLFGLSERAQVTRKGIRWDLDLSEAIDLSIYITSYTEYSTVKAYQRLVKPGDVVLDIGANIGAHTLQFASLTGPRGKVFAFEPAEFAFRKLQRNVQLNPQLSRRIVANQIMLMASPQDKVAPRVYASWPLIRHEDQHEEHVGRPMPTTNSRASTLDDYLALMRVSNVDFIKIDVDGYELEVFRGARILFDRCKPPMIIELAPHHFDETGRNFDELIEQLRYLRYTITDIETGGVYPYDAAEIRRRIPTGTVRNVFARPG